MSSGNPKYHAKLGRGISVKDYAATAPTTTDLVAVDTKGFRWAMFVIHTGVLTMSAGDIAIKIQESSDNFVADTAADVTGAALTALTGSDDNEVHGVVVDCSKTERYLKPFVTYGTVTVSLLSGIWILFEAKDSVYVGTAGADAAIDAVAP